MVSREPPRLSVYDAEAAQDFMKKYATFLNLQGRTELSVELNQLVDMDLLEMMFKLTERSPAIPVVDSLPMKGKARGQVRAELQTPLTPLLKNSGNNEKIGVEEKNGEEASKGVKLNFDQSDLLEGK